VLVYLTLAIVVLMGMAALALDGGCMFITKAQLQNAADAGALAGAAALDGTSSYTQATARAAAGYFAGKNSAVGEAVTLDLNYGNLANGDVVIGCWDSKKSRPTIDISVSCKKPNALKVNARRSAAAGSGPRAVKTMFARVYGIKEMNVGAVAIAYRPSKKDDSSILVQ
jgi:Flp pilus assembly protein TadG